MALDFPVRVRTELGEAERLRQLSLPIEVRRRLPILYWAQRNRRLLTVGVFVFAVLGFSGAWTAGALVVDGPGISLYVRMALDHLGADRMVPYWLPDIWVGAPMWAVTPTLPIFLLVPLATALGPDVAVKVGVLAFQVVGACGTFVLARSLWKNFPAALVAGVLFALQPLVISHGALAGSQPTVGVMAAAPWLVWALRKGLRGDGPGYLAVSGLLGGFGVLMQAEYAIGLALLCACLVAVEAGRVGTGRNQASLGRLLARAAAVVAVGLGSTAYWLLPFIRLGKSFVLSPPELVQGELFNGSAARVGRELGMFFGRSGELSGAVSFNRTGLLPLFFHLGWVCLALTLVSVVFLSRRDRDGTLTAILLSSTLGIWLSTGAVPLASSGPALRSQVVPFVVAGLATGLLVGALLRPLRLGRLAPLFVLGVVAFLAAAPYLTPFVTLQKLIPVFESIRFPRYYTVAPLALALGAAYPVVLAEGWAERRRARSAPAALPQMLAAAVALAVVAVFLVDVWPYRSYYRIHPPPSKAAYREVAANLERVPGNDRIAPTQIEPSAANSLLDTGRPLTVGWPHFVVGKQIWRLTAEPFLTPNAYRERAYGLSATAFQVTELPTAKGTAAEAVQSINLIANPHALPMVRAYSRTVAMADDEITPELAIGVACGLHTWLSTLLAGVDLLNITDGAGAVFRSTTDRLQGVSVYLDRIPDRAELTLHELLPGGRTLGPELARGKAVGTDEYGLYAFTFDPVAGSAGKEYGFVLTCPGCPLDRVPRLVAGHSVDQPGNLLVGGTLRRDRSAAFAPIYEPVAADARSTTTVEPTRPGPGRWRIRAQGAQPALVVVAEAWFPGWEARVDGARAPVVQADGGFVGVPVDAGDHLVTLEYHRPAAATAGRLITVATLLLVAGQAVRRRRRRPMGLRPEAAGRAVPRARTPVEVGAAASRPTPSSRPLPGSRTPRGPSLPTGSASPSSPSPRTPAPPPPPASPADPAPPAPAPPRPTAPEIAAPGPPAPPALPWEPAPADRPVQPPPVPTPLSPAPEPERPAPAAPSAPATDAPSSRSVPPDLPAPPPPARPPRPALPAWPAPVLPAPPPRPRPVEPPAPQESAAPPPPPQAPAPPSDEPDWDEVVRPHRPPSEDDRGPGEPDAGSDPPHRRPTAHWPPEPL